MVRITVCWTVKVDAHLGGYLQGNIVVWDLEGRVCTCCKQYKFWDEFSSKNPKRDKHKTELHTKRQPKCKICAAEDTKNWYKNNKSKAKDSSLMRTYGITLNEYKARLLAQEYRCPICNKHFSDGKFGPDSPVVDHCHVDGNVRGIICNECNRGLGYFRDNAEALMNASKYLTENELTSEGGK